MPVEALSAELKSAPPNAPGNFASEAPTAAPASPGFLRVSIPPAKAPTKTPRSLLA